VRQRILESLKTKKDADETRDEEDRREIDFLLILLILPCSASSASLFIWTPRAVAMPPSVDLFHTGLNYPKQVTFGIGAIQLESAGHLNWGT
jgi:hypothetical protein